MISKERAKLFMLKKHHLIGDYFKNVVEVVHALTSIQFDPVDVCGRNPDILLNSRILGYQKSMLLDELYEKRTLLEQYDKNLCIYETSEWPYFFPIRQVFEKTVDTYFKVSHMDEETLDIVRTQGPISSQDFDNKNYIMHFWGKTKEVRASLDSLYQRGQILIHHRNRNIRYFSLASELGFLELKEYDLHTIYKHLIYRRIKAIGLLWDRPSDAYLGLSFLTKDRKDLIGELLEEGRICTCEVECIKERCLYVKEDAHYWNELGDEAEVRVEFIAPLDSFIWDRKWIKALFDFSYTWEIYTPEAKRQFGYYTLPILRGTTFIGRIELSTPKGEGVLIVKNIWFEKDEYRAYINDIQRAIIRYQKFAQCRETRYEKELIC
ncbi:MAG: crosslink repair DNA glycosylase YcaQ family protein [Bacilli bacterium]|nr:crosslink repair DNA glycosylase YcaQ family protein [Bacilli bacterium]